MPRRKMEVPELFKFNAVGDALKGFLTSAKPQIIGGQTAMRYTIRAERGLAVINGTIQIDECMVDVVIGEMVEIIYTGDQRTTNGQLMRLFDVFTGEDTVVDSKTKEKT